jgi:glycosyltransferase involved in cell wall biosynthesis
MISVILPWVNELRHGYLDQIVQNLCQQQADKELIAVLSPSHDGTAQRLAQYDEIRVIQTQAKNRAQRLNLGIQACRGTGVLLHHPATLLPGQVALQLIEQCLDDATVNWGGFHHSFDMDHWLLRFTSWYSNQVRARRGQILYLDHCIFARRDILLAIGGVPDMDIFEDTALSQRLRPYGPPRLLPASVITSARRFRQRGVYRQAALNQLLKAMYYARLDPVWMNRIYERASQINVTYEASPPDE